ncbi:hypothetical protein D7V93_09880 [Corallococcus llansteffanensis]|uniref:SH3 domain-containing protein n=1 Tax=Corallococcus llansteffanensis TaxID=2316731 RepID=A0A3A8Q1J5_9BACT|nr:hypothetical protein D7V93_09880 [Corallococcus llansteffanensis]
MSSAVLLTAAPAGAQGDEPVTSAKVDLDGDGKPDAVALTPGADGKFALKVGAVTLQGNASGNEVRGFTVVDLDTGDKWKELLVHSIGDMDDDHRFFLYGYDGKAVRSLGDVRALTEAKGNGIVLVDTWMGFWHRREKYTLDRKAWKLTQVPQELYAVGVEATVKKSFALARSRTESAVVATTAQGSKVQVLAAGVPAKAEWNDVWYLVKSSSGLLGWVRGKALLESTEGLPLAG